MKVRVSGLVWVPKAELGPDYLASLKKTLTVVPRKTLWDVEPPTPVVCWSETLEEFGLPRDYFFGTAKAQHDVTWELSEGHPAVYESLLRQEGDYVEQGTALDVLEGWLRGYDTKLALDGPVAAGLHLGGILQADPAFGKTNTALALAHRLGRTALIIVHKEFLLTQWVKRIHKFLPDAKVGIVREDKCDFEGKDIVVAMVQSLALEGMDGKRRYPLDLYTWPGVVFTDEVHRLGALTWSPTPRMFPAKWRVAMSATLRRRDGADKVFWWHIGQVRYHAKTKRPLLGVRMVESGARGPDYIHKEGISPSSVVNVLVKLSRRNQVIIREVVAALKSPAKRKIMVLSERLDHLRELNVILARAVEREGLGEVTTGFYVGEWFTGEKSKKLAKRHWAMDTDGREAAIAAIWRSFRQRRTLKGDKIGAGPQRLLLQHGLAEVGDRAIHLEEEDAWVNLDAELREAELHEHATPSGEEFDAMLFDLAKRYSVKQKVEEKKKHRTDEELDEAERARVIWATYQMCSEGTDIAAVDTLGFATPIGDIEQTYGRGRRVCVPARHGGDKDLETCKHLCPWRWESCTGKPEGIAFDIVDDLIPVAKRRKKYRLEFYDSVKAKVIGAGS